MDGWIEYVPTSSIADAWKSVTRTNRAEAVKRTKVVKATAVTTFLRRRSLAVTGNTWPSSCCFSCGSSWSQPQPSGLTTNSGVGDGSDRESSFQMTHGVSEKTTFFLLRMLTRLIRKHGSRLDPAGAGAGAGTGTGTVTGNANCCWSLWGDSVESGCLFGSVS